MELVLHLADAAARAFRRPAGRPGGRRCRCAPTTANGDAEGLKAKGMVLSRSRPGWPTAAWRVFGDTCGNLLNLHQD